ncbi:MAG: carnitine dehydratase [Hydrocarboniphaga sp.]|uniref:CaiB/BaiF CoA transferase family protein n=1 Tax=Hydrocarboniphaga sp. TaxID=2033016 RepID=UPI00262C963F|nr:CaiB/BaiF CoA-transferase family protein [Hydrocarboniphaga sp.]MDB5970055.1 carnitine dehydratase [Hydrocarboniphaga sp.]
MSQPKLKGPLVGLKVVEFASIGPGPHCAMLLADLGAEVLRIDRAGGNGYPDNPAMSRGRSTVTIDIRSPLGREQCLRIIDKADVLIEGFRPGVMERLGLGPEVVCERNRGLVYGRMTGWGQTGPLAQAAGHDINYIALTGALAAMGKSGEPPIPPLNLVGDFGGGSVYLAFGIMAALWERQKSGQGQIVDAAIVDGAASMMTMFAGVVASGGMSLQRDRNFLSGAAPFYRCYRCADGRYISVGAIEPNFYALLLQKVGAEPEAAQRQYQTDDWPAQSAKLAAIFESKSRDEWSSLLEGSDCCFAPVLELDEAPCHAHMAARDGYIESEGVAYSAPAPRFSRTPGETTPRGPGDETLERWGVSH